MAGLTPAVIVRRLQAYADGRPVPRAETKHHVIAADDDLLIVAFVRMGGESRPWGIAFGHPHRRPTVLTIPEARNRDLVAEMSATFAPALLRHLRAPGWVRRAPANAADMRPLRQVWLPNPTHLEMLHHLAFAYTRTRFGGESQPALNAVGRAAGWMFREAERPGQQTVVVATEALRAAFVFPCEDARQGHLGYLLAWLQGRGDFERRLQRASAAERLAVATSLDPSVERDVLQPLVEDWNSAGREADPGRARRCERAIRAALTEELERRFGLVTEAIATLQRDRRRTNHRLAALVDTTVDRQWNDYARVEEGFAGGNTPFVPATETDRHPAAAAAGYLRRRGDAEEMEWLLVHDDAELLEEVIAQGDAFRGVMEGVMDKSTGRSIQPQWTVRVTAPEELPFEEGDDLCVVGCPGREVEVREVVASEDGDVHVVLRVTKLVTARSREQPPHDRAPVDDAWVGAQLAFIKRSAAGIARLKSRNVWNDDGPGAWLTHRRPGGPLATLPRGDVDVDDVPLAEAAT